MNFFLWISYCSKLLVLSPKKVYFELEDLHHLGFLIHYQYFFHFYHYICFLLALILAVKRRNTWRKCPLGNISASQSTCLHNNHTLTLLNKYKGSVLQSATLFALPMPYFHFAFFDSFRFEAHVLSLVLNDILFLQRKKRSQKLEKLSNFL